VEPYHSAEDFFDACDPQRMGCLLADTQTPGLQGPKAIERLSGKGIHLPVIWLSARPDVNAAVKAVKAGAFHYLGKPCEDEELAEVLQDAIVWDAENRRRLVFCAKVRRRLDRLSPGERQVLELLVDGQSNKGIAAELNVSIRTVEVRRAKLMKKMYVQSLAELIRAIVTVCGCLGASRTLVEQHG
jgi:FixJ family two-component response regulator